MASVPLEFLPPDEPNIVILHIFECATADGSFGEIETVTDVGTFPDYISRYTTNLAISPTDWFAIQWEDDGGALSTLSDPVQGGTKTLVGVLIDRVLLRDSSLNEIVVAQEAETIINMVFNEDPYDLLSDDATFRQISAMTDYILASTKIQNMIEIMSTNSYTAGAISEKTDAVQPVLKALTDLQKKALRTLGLAVSRIGQLGTGRSLGSWMYTRDVWCNDTSRLLAVYGIEEIEVNLVETD